MRLIDADALYDHLSSFTGMFTDEIGFAVNLNQVLDRIDVAPTAQPTWISVDNRLPNPHEDVLVYDATAEAVTCGCLSLLGDWFGVPMKNEVTHWMPLPQPPKGVE